MSGIFLIICFGLLAFFSSGLERTNSLFLMFCIGFPLLGVGVVIPKYSDKTYARTIASMLCAIPGLPQAYLGRKVEGFLFLMIFSISLITFAHMCVQWETIELTGTWAAPCYIYGCSIAILTWTISTCRVGVLCDRMKLKKNVEWDDFEITSPKMESYYKILLIIGFIILIIESFLMIVYGFTSDSRINWSILLISMIAIPICVCYFHSKCTT